MPIISGRVACELSAAGLGMTIGAIGGGVSGGTLTAPAMLAGGAFGYLIGRAVCKIPALQKAFDRAVGFDDWSALDAALSETSTRNQAVVLIEDEIGVSSSRAEKIWDAVILWVSANRNSVVQNPSFRAAAYHPATGVAKHGLAVLNLLSQS